MGFQLIEKESELSHRGGCMVIASDNQNFSSAIDELQGPELRHWAIEQAARRGIAEPGISNMPQAYPVDREGTPITDPLKQAIASYRTDVQVSTGRI